MKPKTGPHHFPDEFEYELHNTAIIISCKKWIGKANLRKIDPWALCYKEWLEKELQKKVTIIQFILNANFTPTDPEFESFKRRISFLNLNNSKINFEILINNNNAVLYNLSELLIRPESEIIQREIKERTADDSPGRLEKDFQAFLFGGTILSSTQNNSDVYRRLGVLGEDFYNLKGNYKIYREYPTGVFNKKVAEKNRILPTYFIDIVAFNKRKELSVIELKLNNSSIEAISQLLDYALFSVAYKDKLSLNLKDNLCPDKFEEKPIACYIVNNHYHPKFESLSKYYLSDSKKFGFNLYMITLGETNII